MAYYNTPALPQSCRGFKQSETKKYRDAVCKELQVQFEQIGGNGNCFFESVALAMQHLPSPISISAEELRTRAVIWLKECKVRTTPSRTPPHTPPRTPPRTPPYSTLQQHARPIATMQPNSHYDTGRKPWCCWARMQQVHGARVRYSFDAVCRKQGCKRNTPKHRLLFGNS